MSPPPSCQNSETSLIMSVFLNEDEIFNCITLTGAPWDQASKNALEEQDPARPDSNPVHVLVISYFSCFT